MDNPITKEQALKSIEDYFIEEAKREVSHCKISNEPPTFCGIYRTWPEDEDVWYVYPPPREFKLGGSRVIVVSKKTGKILFDREVGE